MTKPKRYSQLTNNEKAEVLADPSFVQYAERIKRENWLFSKVEKGKYAGKWATY